MPKEDLDLFCTGGTSPPVPATADPSLATLPATTPEKRKRGKCMSRRSQVGSVEKSGKWYVLRFWKDIPGQDRRIHASERICPISGPGALTKAQRSNKALEIVAAQGVNDPKKFVETSNGVTFREQAKTFVHQKTTSRRKPLKPATLVSVRFLPSTEDVIGGASFSAAC
jgi:hypothetical protein